MTVNTQQKAADVNCRVMNGSYCQSSHIHTTDPHICNVHCVVCVVAMLLLIHISCVTVDSNSTVVDVVCVSVQYCYYYCNTGRD